MMAFDFDPPVPLDVVEPALADPTKAAAASEDAAEESVYISVERNFSCLLIDS